MKSKNRIIAITTLMGIFVSLIGFACPFILSYLVDDISIEYSDDKLLIYILIMIAVYVAGSLLELLSTMVTNRMSVAFKTHESRRMYASMMNMSYPL